jgi:DNA-binding transcriptional MerR regulator
MKAEFIVNIGTVSQKLGMPASTIRYYEKIGLIEPPRRISGRRVFDSRAVSTLEFVRLSQSAGFSISEIKSLLEAYADGHGPADAWTPLAKIKRSEIRAKIAELKQMDQVLTELLSCSCRSLNECVEKGMSRQRGERHARN